MLRIVRGGSTLNQHLLQYAVRHQPSLVIDCANCADPHRIYQQTQLEYDNVYVIGVELLYAFRDVLRALPTYMEQLNITKIVITSFHYLINYHNAEENDEVVQHCIEMIQELSQHYTIVMGVKHGSHSTESKDYVRSVIK